MCVRVVFVQVITIEPGVYIPAAPVLNERAPSRYRGMGIRIEDEVLITDDGHEVRIRNNAVR
jgi:Xaa-Pro aminopeptidase